MGMISANWKELMEPNLRTIWDKSTKTHKDFVETLFKVESSKKQLETNMGIGSVGLMEQWEDSGGQVAYEEINKGFTSQYIHRKYSKGIQIERELLEDDQYREISKRVRGLSQTVYHTKQVHGASVFNNAFNTNFKGPDGKPLCAADHPLSPFNANTYKNADVLTLTADNVEKCRTEAMSWTDDKGNLIPVNLDTIIVPPSLRKSAMVIADTDGEPDTDLNNVNVWKGALNVIEYPFLTNPKAWFLMDSERAAMFLMWFNRRVPKLENGEDFDTEVAKYKTVGRWSFGWDDPSFIFGNNPA